MNEYNLLLQQFNITKENISMLTQQEQCDFWQGFLIACNSERAIISNIQSQNRFHLEIHSSLAQWFTVWPKKSEIDL